MQAAQGIMDRRSARTRAMLQQALMTLILRKGYEAITIKDICETANVGRSTFYGHFTGKDDLKRSGLEGLRRSLARPRQERPPGSGDTREGVFGFSLAMFEHARDHIDLYRALAGSHGGALSMATIRWILSDLVRDDLAAIGNGTSGDSIPRELMVEYVVGAYMAVLTWWLERGAKLPPEQVDAMFRRLAFDGVTHSLRRGQRLSPV
jgi:AcrR family transcriptional regulator